MAINQRKAGSILSYLQIILSNTVALIYTPFMLRLLGQSEYGLFGTANSLTSYLSLFSFGVAGAYIKFNISARHSGNKDEEAKVNGIFFIIYSIISGLVLITGIIFTFLAKPIFGNALSGSELLEIRFVILCTTIQYVITFMFNTVTMAMQAYEKFVFLRVVLLLSNILQPIINVIVLHFYAKAISISVCSLVVSVATYLLFFGYSKKILKMQYCFKNLDKSLIKGIFVFSSFLFLNTIADQITGSTDTLLLGSLAGTAAVAIYTVGTQFGNYFMSFSTAISGVFAPQVNQIFAKDKNDDKSLNDVFVRIGRVQFLVVSFILIGFILFGHQFINLWAGENYGLTSYIIAVLLLLSLYVPLFQNIGIEIQKAKNMHKARSIVYLLIAIANVVFTIVVILLCKYYFPNDLESFKKYASIGAVFVTFVCRLLGQGIFMNIYYHKKVGLNIINFWKNILKIIPSFILPTVIGFLLTKFFVINSFYSLVIEIIIFSLCYIVSVYLLGMNQYEKNLILQPIGKIIKKFKR